MYNASYCCLVLCRFMQFDVSSYETSPEIYALEEKVIKFESYATK